MLLVTFKRCIKCHLLPLFSALNVTSDVMLLCFDEAVMKEDHLFFPGLERPGLGHVYSDLGKVV